MAVKNYKPTSPGRRGMSVSDFAEITRSRPERSLLGGAVNKTGGRNVYGRVTTWQRGGGHRRRYRAIDFRREKFGVPAKVASIEYDPNRSANIALLHYADGEKRYILAPQGLKVGGVVVSGPDSPPEPGNALPLANIPLGSVVHAIEMKARKGAQMVRAAGGAAQLMAREGNYATLRMPSGEHRLIHVGCLATIGQVGRARESEHRQGGPQSLAGQAPQCSGCRDEPGRPPDGRR